MMRVGIIGGGAGGIMAAIAASGCGAQVTILEKNDRIGRKILMTGNGKCNFSNLSFSDGCFYSHEKAAALRIYEAFSAEKTVAFFEGLGMRVKAKNGYLYPASGQASTVLDVLRLGLEESGVRTICGAGIQKAEHKYRKGRGGQFTVCCADGRKFEFDRLVIACGGEACPGSGSDGSGCRLAEKFSHKVYRTVPALVQLRCKGGFWKSIAGIRCGAGLTLLVNNNAAGQERGELQVTDYGISGIAVFQLSRLASYALAEGKKVEMLIDLLPEEDSASLEAMMPERYERHKERTAEAFFTGIIHKKWMRYFMKQHGFRQEACMAEYPCSQAVKLVCAMKRLRVEIEGTNSFQNAQVTAGGVDLAQLTGDLESRLVPGLYFAGEVLDVDGKCGGYNLQWAWSSGYVAGRAAAGCPVTRCVSADCPDKGKPERKTEDT